MGFLDHSTNNIIVDAVLTDAGRRALARNDGSFQVHQFALGDDEVDYEIIEHFGRTVGKEKIEKNTPILEALTAGSLALKHKLVGLDNQFVTHFPLYTIRAEAETVTGTGAAIPVFKRTNSTGANKTKTITIELAPAAGTPDVDDQLLERSLRVEINNIFLKIDNESPDIVYTDNISVYEIGAQGGSGNVTAKAEISLTMKEMTNTTFNVYSTAGGQYIKTFVKVTGLNSGLSSTFEVRIED